MVKAIKKNKSRMTKINEKKRAIKARQKQLNQVFIRVFAKNAIIVLIIIIAAYVIEASGNNKIEGEVISTAYESEVKETYDHNVVTSPANTSNDSDIAAFYKDFSDADKYLLAKIAMAEAESESLNTKVLVICTVLNRVRSNKSYFPDTIWEVIFQKNSDGSYQFTPVGNGRWDSVEPNKECYKAVEIVNYMKYDISQGALYFEACSGESWHSKNLRLVCQSGNTRFYK